MPNLTFYCISDDKHFELCKYIEQMCKDCSTSETFKKIAERKLKKAEMILIETEKTVDEIKKLIDNEKKKLSKKKWKQSSSNDNGTKVFKKKDAPQASKAIIEIDDLSSSSDDSDNDSDSESDGVRSTCQVGNSPSLTSSTH